MKYPFELTQEILDSYQEHAAYISAGQAWLLRNDPEGQTELVLIEAIQTAIQTAAEQHFGDNDDALEEFLQEFEVDAVSGGVWYDLIEEAAE
jgi:hypothetical protein